MGRRHVLAGAAAVTAVAGGLTGCASTWEVVSSRDFKEKPFGTMFHRDDPLNTLRTNPEGGARAAAMAKLREPLPNGGTQADQDELVEQILGPAAATDPSPVVRAAAIDALGRFEDPRAARLLIAAYNQAGPKPRTPSPDPTAPAAGLRLAGSGGKPADAPARLQPRFDLGGP
ncbi:MAG: HEAT repeat domain-containing protein, partial [Fimbriiglobus sp.]